MHETDVMKANTLPLTPVENFNVVSIGEIPEMTVISNYAKSIFSIRNLLTNILAIMSLNYRGLTNLEFLSGK